MTHGSSTLAGRRDVQDRCAICSRLVCRPALRADARRAIRALRRTKSTMTKVQPNIIASQNDAFRAHPVEGWMLTSGVTESGAEFVTKAIEAVCSFDAFTPDNDPYGEHDFGSFRIAGKQLNWKIDYYDQRLEFGSPDPADPAITRRILTVMLAEEY